MALATDAGATAQHAAAEAAVPVYSTMEVNLQLLPLMGSQAPVPHQQRFPADR